MLKQFYSKQFSQAYVQFSSIWPIDRTLLGATTPGQSGPGSNGNEGVLRILQSSRIIRALPSDCFVSYAGHSLGDSYPCAEKQSVYSTAPADRWLGQQKQVQGMLSHRWNGLAHKNQQTRKKKEFKTRDDWVAKVIYFENQFRTSDSVIIPCQ